MELGLSGKVAMVAAATKGLGRAIALELAKEGCRVSVCARSAEALPEVQAALEAAGPGKGAALAVRADVSSAADLAAWHAETVSRLGRPDILVTNTGGPPAGRFLQLTEDQWRQGVESTLMNVIRLCQLVIPSMRERRWGRIVHLTSFVAKEPVDLLTVSSTLRAGLSALTRTLAAQLAPDNVLVNAVLPGHFLTDRQVHLNEIRSKEAGITREAYEAKVQAEIPIRRFGRPEELGQVVAFLCSERASYLSGASLQVDGALIGSTF
jgi:3-oxoacyl-[acyl-carrier protein] reductase